MCPQDVLSAEKIKETFYGSSPKNKQASNSDPFVSQEKRNLTPTARYVVSEAKKQLSHRAVRMGGQGVELEQPEEEELFGLVKSVEEKEGESLSERERTAVVASLAASTDHYDILSTLIQNPEVNDIIVRSYNDISVQVVRKNIQTDLSFADELAYKSFVENLLKRAGKSCTMATPVVDASIDPHIRICVTHESFSPPGSGPMLTLRVSRHKNVSLEGLISSQLAPRVVLDYLSAVIGKAHGTVLIAGEVGTGKTTLVKALCSEIPENEAILIIEDTRELILERRFTRSLLTREANTEGAGRISPGIAIRTGMRMAMNRIILGEMRDSEAAEAFIDVCASGHPGMSTIHAKSARDALSRLELFLSRAQGQVPIETIRRQISDAVAIVVFLGLDQQGQKRRIKEVLEVESPADGLVAISPIFSFQDSSLTYGSGLPTWKREAGVSRFEANFRQAGNPLPQSGKLIGFEAEDEYFSHTERL